MSDDETTRTKTLENLRKSATKFFADRPQYKSMMFGVAQYWADEADDAVHYDICVSEREQPLWPHRCDQTAWDEEGFENIPGEACWNCTEGIGYLDEWDDNGESIPAFQAYCHESGSQDEAPSSNYLPYAVAHRIGDKVEIEIIGRLQRPENVVTDEDGDEDATWDDPRAKELLDLVAAAPSDDGPRRVLADYLLERENPRGEYIALVLDNKIEARALLAEHRRRWMHPLGRVIPVCSTKWARGFLVAGEVIAGESDIGTVRGAPAWSTVEKLFVHRTSDCVLDPAMRSLREIGVLSGDWLEALVDEARPWAIESLAVELQREADSLLLSKATNLPTLRRLEVHSDHLDTVIAALPHASWWPQLERLSVVGGASLAVWHKRRQELRVPWLAVTAAHSDPTDALGWEIALGPNGACEVTLRGFTPHGTLARLGELLPGIPGVSSIKLVRSEFYVPSTVDIERLASATTHPITI